MYKIFFWKLFVSIHEVRNIWSKRKIYKNVKLTKEQKKQIDNFYKENYGKRVPYQWHRLYQSYTGNFDHRYLPEYIYSVKMEPKRNNREGTLILENKNLLESVFIGSNSKVRTPKTYIMCVDGVYFDSERNVITASRVREILDSMNNGSYDAVIKKTVDTGSGRGVRVVSVRNGVDTLEDEPISDVISEMGNDFVVQERISPHESFKALYASSINTLRVVTYMTENDIKVAPIVMRIGSGGKYVDNAHAGGIFIAVDDDGRLANMAFTENQQRFSRHPDTGIQFSEYQLPRVNEIKEVAIYLHKRIPVLQFASWDFTVDKDENIVLIEANLHSQAVWISQMAHGKACFGDDTAEMLKKLRSKQ